MPARKHVLNLSDFASPNVSWIRPDGREDSRCLREEAHPIDSLLALLRSGRGNDDVDI